MNKAELITKVSERANVTQKVAKVIVDTLFNGMRESLEKGERIEIRGFGSFVVRNYGGYKGRNPKTGEIVEVPPKKLPFFKVGKELKEMVNGTEAAATLANQTPVNPVNPEGSGNL
ncbi:MAG: integration host factor subunit beta [Deltaproteobacteria bacterium]|nr:MAG: integration host factor subunit beta [Deltaproteobacteria bacterium]